jgi:hypothetical protein
MVYGTPGATIGAIDEEFVVNFLELLGYFGSVKNRQNPGTFS